MGAERTDSLGSVRTQLTAELRLLVALVLEVFVQTCLVFVHFVASGTVEGHVPVGGGVHRVPCHFSTCYYSSKTKNFSFINIQTFLC